MAHQLVALVPQVVLHVVELQALEPQHQLHVLGVRARPRPEWLQRHPNGSILVKDRANDINICYGENVSSIEVETLL